MPGRVQGYTLVSTPAESNVETEEFLAIYHGGAQVAYDRGYADGHRKGHREGWDEGIIRCMVNENEYDRGVLEKLEYLLKKHDGDTITVPRAFFENQVDVLKAKRRKKQDYIDRRKAARA